MDKDMELKSTKFNNNGCFCNKEYHLKHGSGIYENQVSLAKPKHMWTKEDKTVLDKTICVDMCIVPEIKYLWDIGITTTGSCCGHMKTYANGNSIGFIGVIDSDIDRMKKLGYKIAPPVATMAWRQDSFFPKTVLGNYARSQPTEQIDQGVIRTALHKESGSYDMFAGGKMYAIDLDRCMDKLVIDLQNILQKSRPESKGVEALVEECEIVLAGVKLSKIANNGMVNCDAVIFELNKIKTMLEG